MIDRLIHWSLHNRFLVVSGFLALCAWGLFALQRVPIDAIPDLSENQVIVYADWPGRSPQEVEDQITYPLSVSLQGLAGVKTVRASSMFGFSFLTVIFEDKIDIYFARTRVLERLNSLGDLLPEGVVARLGPDATGLGWVYQYYLKDDVRQAGPGVAAHPAGHLRPLSARRRAGGGRGRQHRRLRAPVPGRGLLAEAASNTAPPWARSWTPSARPTSTSAARPSRRTAPSSSCAASAWCRAIADLETIPVLPRSGTPLYLRDVATIRIGGDFRRGALDVDGREVVGGIVVMRYGENAYRVIQEVKARIAALAPGLPAGRQRGRLLRPQRPDRAGHRHAEGCADRGGHPRHPDAHPLPVPLPQHPDRHPAAAGLHPDLRSS